MAQRLAVRGHAEIERGPGARVDRVQQLHRLDRVVVARLQRDPRPSSIGEAVTSRPGQREARDGRLVAAHRDRVARTDRHVLAQQPVDEPVVGLGVDHEARAMRQPLGVERHAPVADAQRPVDERAIGLELELHARAQHAFEVPGLGVREGRQAGPFRVRVARLQARQHGGPDDRDAMHLALGPGRTDAVVERLADRAAA